MDLWVVAAAAGAGYLAKYWKNHSRDKEGFFDPSSAIGVPERPESPSVIQKLRENTCPIRKLAQKRSVEHNSTEIENELISDAGITETRHSSSLMVNAASTSGSGNEQRIDFLEPDGRGYKRPKESADGFKLDGAISDAPEQCTSEVDASCGRIKDKRPLRSRRLHIQSMKPLNSMESCLMAHLQKEYAENEEYVLGPLSSPCTPLRPFIVSDGRKIINKSSDDPYDLRFNIENSRGWDAVRTEAKEEVLGLPHLPNIVSAEYSRRQKDSKGKGRLVKPNTLRSLASELEAHSGDRSPGGVVLFCLGISMGIISMTVANKSEVDTLQDLLKKTESLVQDLQEELEMKDSLTVKELSNEGHCTLDPSGAPPCCEGPVPFPSQSAAEAVTATTLEGSNLRKASGNEESISLIEAELEAELERLELRMKESCLHGRMQNAIELDPDFVAEVVQGDLRADVISRRADSEPDGADRDFSSTSTNISGKHSVSPRELSLRIHQVIQSRLEARIVELEAALEESQKTIKELESEHLNSWTEFPKRGYPSTQGSPVAIEISRHVVRPLLMNLSRDALDAYNEAFDDLKTTHGSVNEFDLHEECRGNSADGSSSFGGSDCEDHKRGMYSSVPKSKDAEGDATSVFTLAFQQSDDVSPPSGNAEDDDMALLIKQIVERTRQGSPALFNAHRAMVSLDKNKQ